MASGITINSNIASLNAQRRLGHASKATTQSYTRLSSGLRITKAADDTAGLAIASGLSIDRVVYNKGIRNLNDGLSMASIADAAVESLSNIVLRLSELAEQCANGTLGKKQREALDGEAQLLSREYARIAKSTEFNDMQLLDGSVQEVILQAGYGTEGQLVGSFGGVIGTGSFAASTAFSTGTDPSCVVLGDLNGDGMLDLVTADTANANVSVMLGNGNGSFGTRATFAAGGSPSSVALGDLNGDGILDMVTADSADDTVSVMLGNGDGSFGTRTAFATGDNPYSVSLGDLNGDGVVDLVTADYSSNKASVMLGNGDGSFQARTSYTTGSSPRSVKLGDLNGDGVLDLVTADSLFISNSVSVMLGQGDGTFGVRTSFATGNSPYSVSLGDLNGDGVLDLVTAEYVSNTASVRLGNGDGSFQARKSYATGMAPMSAVLGDLNGDGVLDLATADYTSRVVSVRLGIGDGTFGDRASFSANSALCNNVTLGDVNNDGVLDLATSNISDETVAILIATTQHGSAPLLSFDLSTMAGARQALPVFKQKLAQLSSQRGEIGAYQARIAVAANNLGATSENFAAAESRIRDADIAEESAQLVKNQILQQAGTAVLAQANQQPALVLGLLNTI